MRDKIPTKHTAYGGSGMIDIHCHILPHVDDGADNLDVSMSLLRKEYEDGVRAIILTPHYRRRMFENEEPEIMAAYKMLSKAAVDEFPGMVLYLGCELHSNMDMLEMLAERKQFLMAGSRYVLVEFSSADEASYIRERVYSLCANGYMPVIAHVERYPCLVRDMELVETMSEMGAYLQINADSIVGRDGFGVKRFCRDLLERGMVDFVGSDAHDMKHRPPRLGECAAWIEKKIGADYMRKIMYDNPMKIIQAGGTYGDQ